MEETREREEEEGTDPTGLIEGVTNHFGEIRDSGIQQFEEAISNIFNQPHYINNRGIPFLTQRIEPSSIPISEITNGSQIRELARQIYPFPLSSNDMVDHVSIEDIIKIEEKKKQEEEEVEKKEKERRTNEKMKEIDEELESYIYDEAHVFRTKDIKSIVEEIYGEENTWVRSKMRNIDEREIEVNIKFPSITITNQNGNSHVIKDLIIKLIFNQELV